MFYTFCSLIVLWMNCIHFRYIIHQGGKGTSFKKFLTYGSVWTHWRSIKVHTLLLHIQIKAVRWSWFTWWKELNLPDDGAGGDALKSLYADVLQLTLEWQKFQKSNFILQSLQWVITAVCVSVWATAFNTTHRWAFQESNSVMGVNFVAISI